MEFNKVVAGLVKYIDRNICPNMNALQEIGYRALCSRVMSNLEQYKTAISNNAFLQTFAIIDADGNVDLEGLVSAKLFGEIFTRRGVDSLGRFFANASLNCGNNAENRKATFKHSVNIGKLVDRLDKHGALRRMYVKASVALCPSLQFAGEHCLKMWAVGALEHDLAVFAKNYLFHFFFSAAK